MFLTAWVWIQSNWTQKSTSIASPTTQSWKQIYFTQSAGKQRLWLFLLRKPVVGVRPDNMKLQVFILKGHNPTMSSCWCSDMKKPHTDSKVQTLLFLLIDAHCGPQPLPDEWNWAQVKSFDPVQPVRLSVPVSSEQASCIPWSFTGKQKILQIPQKPQLCIDVVLQLNTFEVLFWFSVRKSV